MEPTPIPDEAVRRLAASARRLSWGYFALVALYMAIGLYFVYHGMGMRWAGFGQWVRTVLRLADVFAALSVYVALNAGIGSGLRFMSSLHPALRWAIAAAAAGLALWTAGVWGLGLWRWYIADFHAAHVARQGLGLLLFLVYLALALRVIHLVRAFGRFVLIEGSWLPKLPPERAGTRVVDL